MRTSILLLMISIIQAATSMSHFLPRNVEDRALLTDFCDAVHDCCKRTVSEGEHFFVFSDTIWSNETCTILSLPDSPGSFFFERLPEKYSDCPCMDDVQRVVVLTTHAEYGRLFGVSRFRIGRGPVGECDSVCLTGSRFASIHNVSENQEALEYIQTFRNSTDWNIDNGIVIGLDRNSKLPLSDPAGKYRWFDNSLIDYANWTIGQPGRSPPKWVMTLSSPAFNVFSQVTIDSLPLCRDNATVYKCAESCLQKTVGNAFCFGFSLVGPGNKCVPNMSPGISEMGDYFMLTDYRSTVATEQCGSNDNPILAVNRFTGSPYITRIFNGSVYYFDKSLTKGSECRTQCRKLNMHVTSIHSKEENQFIHEFVCALFYSPLPNCVSTNPKNQICHLGVYLEEMPTSVQNLDGTPADYVKWGEPPYRPFGSGDGQRCFQMKSSGTWINAFCDQSESLANCVCRKSLDFVD